MNTLAKYEFFAGYDSKQRPIWTRDFARIKPLVDWNNNCGCVTMTYDAPLREVPDVHYRRRKIPFQNINTYILESDRVAGPWKLVVYMHEFGRTGLFL